MAHSLFVSDLHLDPAWPQITERFLRFLAGPAREAEALFILGDLFEAWIGDDDDEPHHRSVIEALAALTGSGVPCSLAHGNRDFLLGNDFAAKSGCQLLDDPSTIELYGTPTLLTHGDIFCTDDARYLEVRALLRSPGWQEDFLAKPLAERRKIAAELREQSETVKRVTADELMDVNPDAVATAMREHGATRLIHGHTHRPANHRLSLATPAGVLDVERIVLADWTASYGEALRVDASGTSRMPLSD